MKRAISVFSILMVLAASLVAKERDKESDILDARAALEAFLDADTSLAAELEETAGYAVFEDVGKGGFIIGGSHGWGVVFDNTGNPIGSTELTQVTVGFQAGGQSFSELILFESRLALRNFQRGNFTMSAQATAVAASAGAAASAPYANGVKILTLVKGGLMYEASVGGQKFEYADY